MSTEKSGNDFVNHVLGDNLSKMFSANPLDSLEIEVKQEPSKYYAVQYAGFWTVQDSANYSGKDILNSEHVGAEESKRYVELIVAFLNEEL